jgi:hypothetical protein
LSPACPSSDPSRDPDDLDPDDLEPDDLDPACTLSRSRISLSSSMSVGSAGPGSSPRLRRCWMVFIGSTMTK